MLGFVKILRDLTERKQCEDAIKKYIGMSKEIMANLFTPQMKTLSEARKKNKGAGIGLLLVKGFLEKNSGEIWVESIEGEGSSFYFTLPKEKPLYKSGISAEVMFDESTE